MTRSPIVPEPVSHKPCSFQRNNVMDGYDDTSRTLRWDSKGASEAELLCLLRLYAGTLRQLHVT